MALLYEAAVKELDPADLLADLVVAPSDFVRDRVVAVAQAVPQINTLLAEHAKNWDIERIARLDLVILHIAVWELLYDATLDVAIILSEAVALAKRFSTEESGRFVNGVAGAIAAAVGRT